MMTYVELLNKYQGMIWKIIHKFPSIFTEDLYQESCIALWKAYKIGELDRGSFTSFVYKYIHGSCCQYMRDKANLIRVSARKAEQGESIPCQSLNQTIYDSAGKEVTLEEFVGTEFKDLDLTLDLKSLMHKICMHDLLSTEEKFLLYKRGYLGKDYRSLAEELGISAPAVMNRYHRLIAKLRPYFIGTKVFSRKK